MDDPALLTALQRRIGYTFEDGALLERAITHRSWAHDQQPPPADNERLEFLGDAVLGLVVAEELFSRFPDNEGHLTRARAKLVRTEALADFARGLDLGRCMRLSKGEETTGGRDKNSILADGFEALLGAIHRDGGIEAARGFVLRALGPALEPDAEGRVRSPRDVCTRLQERLQGAGEAAPSYRELERGGPDHAPTWRVEVRSKARVLGEGSGSSKQAARREAAHQALLSLDREGGE